MGAVPGFPPSVFCARQISGKLNFAVFVDQPRLRPGQTAGVRNGDGLLFETEAIAS
jgi:hypothetical protein